MLQFIKNIFNRALIISLLVLSPLYSLSQCEVHIVDGSVEVVDTSPGVKFTFDVINESNSPWSEGTLHFGWTLESSNPDLSPVMWDIQLNQPIQPGDIITLTTPIYDLPAIWENPLSNNPSPSNPWSDALDWPTFNSIMFPDGFTGTWSPFRLTLYCDEWSAPSDQIFVYNPDGSNYYGPSISGCPNINNDFLCDCDIELYDFNLLPDPQAKVIIKSDYNCYPASYPPSLYYWENPGITSMVFGITTEENDYCSPPVGLYNFFIITELMFPDYILGDTTIIDLSNTILWNYCLEDYVNSPEYVDCYEAVIWQINQGTNVFESNDEITPNDNVIIKEDDSCKPCDLELISAEWPYFTVVANQSEGCFNDNLPSWLNENPDVIHNFTIHINDIDGNGCSITFGDAMIPDMSSGDTLTISVSSPFPSPCYDQAQELVNNACQVTFSVEDINGMINVDDIPDNNQMTLFENSPCMADVTINANLETYCDSTLGAYVIPYLEVTNLSDIVVEEFCIEYSYDLNSGVDILCYNGLNLDSESIINITMDTIFFDSNQEDVLGFYSVVNVNGNNDISDYGYDYDTLNNSSASILVFDCIYGCMDSGAQNYNSLANVEDGSCEYLISGCTDFLANNYNPNATEDDGSCEYLVDLSLDSISIVEYCDGVDPYWSQTLHMSNLGLSDITEFCVKVQLIGVSNDTICFSGSEYTISPSGNISLEWPEYFYDYGVVSIHILHINGESIYSWYYYGEDTNILNNQLVVNMGEPSIDCDIYGCTDPLACNYNPEATSENGSCEYPDFGYDCNGDCINDIDSDNICDEFEIPGCTDPSACNYNPEATDENGSCEYPEIGYDCNGDCLNDSDFDGICDEYEVYGCTDNNAVNYNPMATEDDGSCIFITESDPCDDVIVETFIPNAMTPNGDGYNDVWGAITHPDCWRTWDLRIYNRWGVLVWMSDDPRQMWDGMTNNSVNNHYISEGVYVYSIQAVTYGNEVIQKTGFIVVIK